MTKEYREAAAEVLDILEHTDAERINLIPKDFIHYLRKNSENNYTANIDYSKPFNEMDLKIETKAILLKICINWWWNKEEKQEYTKLIREKEIKHQEELKEKYNPNNIFKKEN